MLEPDHRLLLVDALRPPAGMQLRHAVGTTFSLDLDALLLAPVTFALRDAQVAESGQSTDPLSVLEAVRRHAANIDLFFQAGQVGVSSGYRPMLAQLEAGVHPCAARRDGRIFHPKVWLLRYGDENDNTAYRLLVMSRNLSFSHSWDTMLRLDGTYGTDLQVRNAPLADFVRALPDLTLTDSPRLTRVTQLADEIRRVEWEIPAGFEALEFLAFGLDEEPRIESGQRNLVVSPFVSDAVLNTLGGNGGGHVLISRSESLDRLSPTTLKTFAQVYTLNSSALGDELDGEPQADEAVAEAFGSTLLGLHAKLFISERTGKTEVVTGSANATEAAFGGNVEFSVRLVGPTRACGIKAFLGGAETEASLISMLEPYRQTPEPLDAPDDADTARSRLEATGRRLASQPYRLTVTSRDDDRFDAELATSTPISIPEDVDARVRLLSKGDASSAQLVTGDTTVSFTTLSLDALTSFVRIDLATNSAEGPIETSVVAVAEMVGAPEDRHERLLASLLQSREDVLRYLLFLLADDSNDAALTEAAHLVAGTADQTNKRTLRIPLFETMVRALARNPESLDQVARIVSDLSRTEEGKALLPEGLAELWPAMDEARMAINR